MVSHNLTNIPFSSSGIGFGCSSGNNAGKKGSIKFAEQVLLNMDFSERINYGWYTLNPSPFFFQVDLDHHGREVEKYDRSKLRSWKKAKVTFSENNQNRDQNNIIFYNNEILRWFKSREGNLVKWERPLPSLQTRRRRRKRCLRWLFRISCDNSVIFFPTRLSSIFFIPGEPVQPDGQWDDQPEQELARCKTLCLQEQGVLKFTFSLDLFLYRFKSKWF